MGSYIYKKEREKNNPSFSSTLLDAIYRSIDEGDEELMLCTETMRKKNNNNSLKSAEADFHERSCMIEKWMENKVTNKVSVRRKSAGDFERKGVKMDQNALYFHSSSSSSDSSGFSSSEAEFCDSGISARSSSCYGLPKPKPIKTSISAQELRRDCSVLQPKTEQGGRYMKTKSRALKIYGDLKKVKQPISPGGRLASFLNTLFTTGNAKKSNISSNGIHEQVGSKSANASTCSSASSFSRSCLSKTPSSRGKSSNGTKRSVRFYPVSVIVDEDCQPCGHKNLYDDKEAMENLKIRKSINEELKFQVMEKNRRVEEAARALLRNYQKKLGDYEMRDAIKQVNNGDYDDDDAASDASSDLFELDNLSAIGNGIEKYCQELPVYETTRFDTNRAIANGFIL